MTKKKRVSVPADCSVDVSDFRPDSLSIAPSECASSFPASYVPSEPSPLPSSSSPSPSLPPGFDVAYSELLGLLATARSDVDRGLLCVRFSNRFPGLIFFGFDLRTGTPSFGTYHA